jgi:hypothetical protein
MRTIPIALILAVIAFAESAAQSPAIAPVPPPMCLNATDIRSTGVVDNRTIVFTMNNGAQWKNTLQADCPGLRIAGGFDYMITAGAVCANEQRIRVHGGPSTCFLGPFTRVTPN